MCRHGVYGGEPALGDLLLPAFVIQLQHSDIQRIIDVGIKWIVERQIPVLADSKRADLRVNRFQHRCIFAACRFREIRAALDFIELFDRNSLRQMFSQVAAKRRKMAAEIPSYSSMERGKYTTSEPTFAFVIFIISILRLLLATFIILFSLGRSIPKVKLFRSSP